MTRGPTSRGPVVALIPVGKYAGQPAITLRRPINLVGGAEVANVRLTSRSVDPVHAMVIVSDGHAFVRDLASHAGVSVNGEAVREAELRRDDMLTIGSFEFRVSLPDAAGQAPAPAAATFLFDGQHVTMDGRVLLVGRRSACDVVLSDPQASRVHAAVVAVGGGHVVRDLGSRAGTLVNADVVHERTLEDGDEIHIASHAIFYQQGAAAVGAAGAGGDLVSFDDDSSLAGEPVVAGEAGREEDLLSLDLTPEPVEESAEAPIPVDVSVEPSAAAEEPAIPAAGADEPIPLEGVAVPEVDEAAAPSPATDDAAAADEEGLIPLDIEPAPAREEAARPVEEQQHPDFPVGAETEAVVDEAVPVAEAEPEPEATPQTISVAESAEAEDVPLAFEQGAKGKIGEATVPIDVAGEPPAGIERSGDGEMVVPEPEELGAEASVAEEGDEGTAPEAEEAPAIAAAEPILDEPPAVEESAQEEKGTQLVSNPEAGEIAVADAMPMAEEQATPVVEPSNEEVVGEMTVPVVPAVAEGTVELELGAGQSAVADSADEGPETISLASGPSFTADEELSSEAGEVPAAEVDQRHTDEQAHEPVGEISVVEEQASELPAAGDVAGLADAETFPIAPPEESAAESSEPSSALSESAGEPGVAAREDDVLAWIDEAAEDAQAAAATSSEPRAGDDLSQTPFATAGEEEGAIRPPPTVPSPEPGPVSEVSTSEPPPVTTPPAAPPVGANQIFYLTGSPLPAYEDFGPFAAPVGPQSVELSLSGVDMGPAVVEPAEAPPAQTVASAVEDVEEFEEPAGPVAESAAAVAEPSQLADEPPPPAPDVAPPERRDQLLGFIRVPEPKTAARPGAPPAVEPVGNVVAPDPAAAESPGVGEVDLSLNQDEARPGTAAPKEAVAPEQGLHAVKPPPAARGFARGLSSFTGGGRAVDVFSQLPVLSEDPVLGKVSAPAQLPSLDDPTLHDEPPVDVEDLDRAVKQYDPARQPDDEDRRGPKSSSPLVRKFKRFFRDRGRPLAIAGAAMAAGVVAYVATPRHAFVRAEVKYPGLEGAPAAVREALHARQRALLTDPATLASAGDRVAGEGVPAGFLADPVLADRRLDRPEKDLWPRPDALSISFESTDPDRDRRRLRALVRTVVDAPANRQAAATGARDADRVGQLKGQVAQLDRNIAELERRYNEQARLASAADTAGADAPSAAAAGEPSPAERAWREASLARLRAQSDLADLTDRHVPATDPRVRQARSRLEKAQTEESRLAREVAASSDNAAAPGDDVQRRAALTSASLKNLRDRRAAAQRDLEQLQSQRAAAPAPQLGPDDGTWTNPAPDHRAAIALAATALAGTAVAFLTRSVR